MVVEASVQIGQCMIDEGPGANISGQMMQTLVALCARMTQPDTSTRTP